jgi:phage minor structural protein
MINVYGANESTFAKNGLATLRPISAEFIPQINGSWVLKCTVPFDEQLKYQYIEEQNIVQVDQACIREIGLRQLFRIYEVTKNLDSVSFIACPLGMEAVYDAPIEEIQITDKTGVQAVEALSDYLTEHGITKYTLASDITRTATTEFENTNLIAVISGNDDNSLVNKYAGEVVYDNATIYLKNKVGLQDKARTVAYGRNLTGLKCNIDTANMITRVYPLSNDDLRLHEYPDTEIPTGQTYIDTSDPNAPIRAAFIDTDYKLVDTTKNSNSATATKTREWQAAILEAITSKAEELWDTAIDDMTNTYCPDYIKGLVNGDDGIIKYTQARYVYSHKGWQSIIKSLIKQGVEWIKEAEVPEKAWIHTKTTYNYIGGF